MEWDDGLLSINKFRRFQPSAESGLFLSVYPHTDKEGWKMGIASLRIGRAVAMHRALRTRGIGHFAAIALSAAAAVGFFMILYPVAKDMMNETVTSMQTVQQTVLNSTICSTGNCT